MAALLHCTTWWSVTRRVNPFDCADGTSALYARSSQNGAMAPMGVDEPGVVLFESLALDSVGRVDSQPLHDTQRLVASTPKYLNGIGSGTRVPSMSHSPAGNSGVPLLTSSNAAGITD